MWRDPIASTTIRYYISKQSEYSVIYINVKNSKSCLIINNKYRENLIASITARYYISKQTKYSTSFYGVKSEMHDKIIVT